jgi:hypothetical protein
MDYLKVANYDTHGIWVEEISRIDSAASLTNGAV